MLSDYENIDILIGAVRHIIFGGALPADFDSRLTPDALNKLLFTAKRHGLAQILACEMLERGLLANYKTDPLEKSLRDEVAKAVAKCEKQQIEFARQQDLFNKVKIPFIPLKGAYIRSLYPEPWMRTSCDIDILVKESDLEYAARELEQKLGYTNRGRSAHDMLFASKNGVYLELHYNLFNSGGVLNSDGVLSGVWDNAHDIGRYRFEMSEELTYVYHIAHMVKHFVIGGCGVRSFIDLKLLQNKGGFDRKKTDALLEIGGFLKFEKAVTELASVWFDSAEHTELTRRLELYIVEGGVMGNIKNRVAIGQQRERGKLKYILSRLFVPYDVMKKEHPELEKHKWLLPVFELKRMWRVISSGRGRTAALELKLNNSVPDDRRENVEYLLKHLELNKKI